MLSELAERERGGSEGRLGLGGEGGLESWSEGKNWRKTGKCEWMYSKRGNERGTENEADLHLPCGLSCLIALQ